MITLGEMKEKLEEAISCFGPDARIALVQTNKNISRALESIEICIDGEETVVVNNVVHFPAVCLYIELESKT